MSFIPRHHTVVAYLALFSAVGGGAAYAAVTLPAKSVGTKQLRAGAVTGAKVKDGSLTLADFAADALSAPAGTTGTKGDAGSAGSTGAVGPAGVDGRPGATGATGPAGPAGKDGAVGPAGPAGKDGQDGQDGPAGPAGKDATLEPQPGATASGAYYVDDATPGNAENCAPRAQGFPRNGKETIVAFGALDGFERTSCTRGYGLIVPKAGVYTVSMNFLWNAEPNGFRAVGLKQLHNGFARYVAEERQIAVPNSETAQNVTVTKRFEANDVIQVYVVHTGAYDVSAVSDGRTALHVQYVGA